MKQNLLRLFTATLMLVALSFASEAALVSPSQAAARIGTDVYKSPSMNRLKGRASTLRLAHTEQVDGQAAFYVFNVGSNGGFVIAPADDEARAVVAYADNGSFDPNAIPENMREFLKTYSLEIKALREGKVIKSANAPQDESFEPVEPLLGNIIWDQDSPFNDQCPIYSGSEHCATGCVATAFGQIMYYYKYPASGTGTKSYTHGSQTWNMNYNTNYDWNSMLPFYNDESSETAKSSVAKLMWHLGTAFDMDYGQSSGALTATAVNAMHTYFGYDKSVRLYYRDYYALSHWESMLRDEIRNNHPISYSGSSDSGGHQFVLDGYDADGLFHVNWGWSGMSNGYFAVSALTPPSQGIGGSNSGYSYNQSATLNLMPEYGSGLSYSAVPFAYQFTTSASTVTAGGSATFSMGYLLNRVLQAGFEGSVGIAVYADGNLVQAPRSLVSVTIDKATASGSSIYFAYTEINDITITLPRFNTSKTVIFRPVYTQPGDAEWHPVGIYPPDSEIVAKYANGTYTFNTDTENNMGIINVKANYCYQDIETILSFDVTNTNSIRFDKTISYAVTSSTNSNDVKLRLGTADISVESNATTHIEIPFTISESDLAKGTYRLIIYKDENYSQFWGSTDLILQAKPADPVFTITAIEYPYGNSFSDNDVKLRFKVRNSGGFYRGPFLVYVYDEELNSTRVFFGLNNFMLKAGETTTLDFEGVVPLKQGHYYGALGRLINNRISIIYNGPTDRAEFYLNGGSLKGDLNGDGSVDGSDVSILLEMVLSGGLTADQIAVADLNGDTSVDGSDVSILLEMVLSGE